MVTLKEKKMGDMPKDIKDKIQQGQERFKEQYIGKYFKDVEQEFKEKAIVYRIVKVDKEYFIVTQDIKIHRANLEITDGLIANIYFG